MIILSQNCRGCCKYSALDYFYVLWDKGNLYIIILLETHVQLPKIREVRKVIMFDNKSASIGRFGHILVFERVVLERLSSCKSINSVSLD